MLNINDTINGFDVAELLQSESGVFEATSPSGEKYRVVCRQGASITNFRPTEKHEQAARTWSVRKVGEIQRQEQQQATR